MGCVQNPYWVREILETLMYPLFSQNSTIPIGFIIFLKVCFNSSSRIHSPLSPPFPSHLLKPKPPADIFLSVYPKFYASLHITSPLQHKNRQHLVEPDMSRPGAGRDSKAQVQCQASAGICLTFMHRLLFHRVR